MEAIKLQAHVGSDGILKLEVPVDVTDEDVEIIVTIKPIHKMESTDDLGYPLGYFEETYGAFADDPLERPPQGEYEIRDELL